MNLWHLQSKITQMQMLTISGLILCFLMFLIFATYFVYSPSKDLENNYATWAKVNFIADLLFFLYLAD